MALASLSPLKSVELLASPSKTFQRVATTMEEASVRTQSPGKASSQSLWNRINLPLLLEIKWKALKQCALEWLRDPKNLALLAWIVAVAVSAGILCMVMGGILDSATRSKKTRDAWFEVNNQILNALFTLMCLYVHPQRCLHLFQLWRWRPCDNLALRVAYCKDSKRKPHEWMHMVVVVVLLHLNCFSQYALCGLNWGYKRSQRPAFGVAIALISAISFGSAAGIYKRFSPLGRDFVPEEEAESIQELELAAALEACEREKINGQASVASYRLLQRKLSLGYEDGRILDHPEWKDGLFDCCSEPGLAITTTFCGFCVFARNMERLRFGNKYVHAATFLLLCSAPFFTFNLAAVNIENRYVRRALGMAGIVLSLFGLMYGGFWRIRMRKTYGLPAQRWCCNQPNMADCTQWLFCSLCSLCQEVRTAEFYEIHNDKFYLAATAKGDLAEPRPLERQKTAATSAFPTKSFDIPAPHASAISQVLEQALTDTALVMVPPMLVSAGERSH